MGRYGDIKSNQDIGDFIDPMGSHYEFDADGMKVSYMTKKEMILCCLGIFLHDDRELSKYIDPNLGLLHNEKRQLAIQNGFVSSSSGYDYRVEDKLMHVVQLNADLSTKCIVNPLENLAFYEFELLII